MMSSYDDDYSMNYIAIYNSDNLLVTLECANGSLEFEQG